MKNLIDPFKSIWQFLFVNFLIGIFCAVLFIGNATEHPLSFLIATGWGMALFISQWLGHSYIQTSIAKRHSWIENPAKRLIYTLISVPLYSIFAYIVVQGIMEYLVNGVSPSSWLPTDLREWLIPIFISFFISLLAAAFGFFSNLKNSIIEQEKLERQMMSYKYEALRNQINPHFMFNSLNVLSDLVYEDQELAVKFIHKFSEIYRYVLESRDQELVKLKDELSFVKTYVFLLKIRFEEKLIVAINIDATEDELIVPMSLQLLVENAVKHNEISKANPLMINIDRRDNEVIVSNAIHLKQLPTATTKIGLINLSHQFSYFSDKKPIITSTDTTFSVKLPILRRI